jgi:carbon storage regulator CsrA
LRLRAWCFPENKEGVEMLVLTLSLGEGQDDEIRIDGTIRVKLIEVQSNKIRLGIEAPESMPVDRLSVHLSKQAERRAARRASQMAWV